MSVDCDYGALAEFRYQIRRFLIFSERETRSAGIEPQQHQLLLAIRGLPPGARPTISTLAERLQLRHHSVVELINRLEKTGLAARKTGDSDRREVLVELTAAGRRLLKRLSIAHRTELLTAAPALTEALMDIVSPRSLRRHRPARIK